MKHFAFDSHWTSIQGQLKQRYAQLTDDDLLFAEGKGEELLGRLRTRLSLSADQLANVLDELHTEALSKWEHVKEQVGDLASDARKRAGEMATDCQNAASAVGAEVKSKTEAAYCKTMQGVRTLQQDGGEYVREHPGKSLLIAIGAGFLAGLLIRR